MVDRNSRTLAGIENGTDIVGEHGERVAGELVEIDDAAINRSDGDSVGSDDTDAIFMPRPEQHKRRDWKIAFLAAGAAVVEATDDSLQYSQDNSGGSGDTNAIGMSRLERQQQRRDKKMAVLAAAHAAVTGRDDLLQHPQGIFTVQARNSTAVAAVPTGEHDDSGRTTPNRGDGNSGGIDDTGAISVPSLEHQQRAALCYAAFARVDGNSGGIDDTGDISVPSLEHQQRALLYAAFARVKIGGDDPLPLQHQQEIVAMLGGNSTAAAVVQTVRIAATRETEIAGKDRRIGELEAVIDKQKMDCEEDINAVRSELEGKVTEAETLCSIVSK